jgi:hypothetical protein
MSTISSVASPNKLLDAEKLFISLAITLIQSSCAMSIAGEMLSDVASGCRNFVRILLIVSAGKI